MVIFGTRSKIVDGPAVRGHSCSQCGQGEHVSFGTLRYFHIFWIPVLPFSRTIGVQCVNCKRTVMDQEVSGAFRDTIRESVFTRGRVLPLFTGSLLIAAFVAFGVYSAQQDDKLEAQYAQSPVVSDIYVMDFSRIFDDVDRGYKYGVMRVESVDDETVELSVSNYGYSRSTIPASDLARDMARDDFFSEGTVKVGREDLIAFKNDKTILDIRRRR